MMSAPLTPFSQEARDAFYMKNYPDWFASIDKTLIKKPDGSFVVVTQDELAALRRDNRLTTVMPKAMGGQVTDYTQKPILMFRDDQ
jgi:hypothetical protein